MDKAQETGKKSAKRGTTKQKNLQVDRAENLTTHLPITFTADYQWVGDNATSFSTFIGVQVRTKIPINILNWKKVNPKIKKKIFAEIKISHPFLKTKHLPFEAQEEPIIDWGGPYLNQLAQFCDNYGADDLVIKIPTPEEVFGFENDVFFSLQALKELLMNQRLDNNWIALCLRYIHETSKASSKNDYCFLSPFALATQGTMRESRITYIAEQFLKFKNNLFFIPILRSAYCTYHLNRGPNSSRNNVDLMWIRRRCPQQVSDWECGYYVMWIMIELLSRGVNNETIATEELPTYTHSPETINEVKELMVEYYFQCPKSNRA